ELVEFLQRPGAALALHAARIVEARHGGARPPDDPIEIGSELGGAALLEGMAREADLGGVLAALGVGIGQELRNRRLLFGWCLFLTAGRFLRNLDAVAGLGGLLRRKEIGRASCRESV